MRMGGKGELGTEIRSFENSILGKGETRPPSYRLTLRQILPRPSLRNSSYRYHKVGWFAAKVNVFLMNGGNGCVLGAEICFLAARAGFGGFKTYYFSMHRQGFRR